ncbi:polysaccharide pyruvyl transferase family protein [Halomonas maura]|uniref:polysaccharide pyruvyl transferase family protein n=1 Tax=Halomonas maura TaxID=117606 RepID=UPI0025B4621A|nr:polysaccharide pyruvyl transferase family protein [Halomonas maura]MDN3555239.1 polysaccharide pyruvyl transferase family protein [Halomonas maura]
MKVCLVNDTSDDPNWGARATSYALRELIRDAGGQVASTLYQYRIGIPQPDDSVDGQADDDPVIDVAPTCWQEFEECALGVMQGAAFPAIGKALHDCDIVLVNGEGCIYDLTRQSRMIFFIAYLAKCFFDKPTAMVNHSIVMNDPALREIARHIYPLLDDIVFREPDSARACPAGQGRVAADAAYLYQPEPVEQWWPSTAFGLSHERPFRGEAFDPRQPYACIGGGSVYFRGLQPDHDAIPGFIRLCREMQASVGQVLLTASSDKDLRILAPVAERLDLPLAGASLPIQFAVNLLGNARVYVGARWHPSIFAHSGGTPVIALSRHTPKMDAFLKQADMPPSHLDPFSLESQLDEVLNLVATQLAAGAPLRASLKAKAARLGETVGENVRVLTERLAACT